jgi:hypothetical protein
MYKTVMDPRTANDITDRIGLWAREAGFKGIVYPSARYGQRLDWPGDQKRAAFPALEFVEIGSHLCEQGVAMQMTLNALAAALAELSFDDPPPIVFSEPNLVIFDEDHVAGRDRPVFYATYALREADLVRLNDERKGIKHRLQFAYDGDEIMLFVDDPEFAFVARAPRHPHPGAPAVISYHHARTPDNAMRELDPDEKPSREIVEEKRRRFGPDHLETLSSVRSLAALQEAAGELPRAQAMFFGCLQGCRRTLGAGHGLTKSVEQDFRRCNQRLVRMKQAGESLPENNRTAEALVNLGDGQWRKAAARHLEANVYLVLLPIDPSMPPPTAEVLITIEWARATHVVSPKLRVTAQGELALMASLQ